MGTLGKRFHVKFLGYAHWFMSISISNIKIHSISVDQARYATAAVLKYLDTATIKENPILHKSTFPSDMLFTKEDASTSDKKVEALYIDYNIHYRYFLGSLIYILSIIVCLCFAVHKLVKFSSNPGKVHFEVLVHLLRYIRDNNNLVLKYCSKIYDAPLSDLLIQASIKPDKQLMVFSDSI